MPKFDLTTGWLTPTFPPLAQRWVNGRQVRGPPVVPSHGAGGLRGAFCKRTPEQRHGPEGCWEVGNQGGIQVTAFETSTQNEGVQRLLPLSTTLSVKRVQMAPIITSRGKEMKSKR
jgi:hypothetical protein